METVFMHIYSTDAQYYVIDGYTERCFVHDSPSRI